MVRFSDVKEFLDELGKEKDHIECRIVRLTNLYRPSPRVPSVQHLSVTATTRVGRGVVRLDVYCGDLWHLDRHQPVLDKAQALDKSVEEGSARLGLEVRAGVLEDGKEG